MVEVWQRNQDLNHLHPILRSKIPELLSRLSQDNIPFRLFEGFRSPQRQRYLYEQGRTRPGNIVTKAKPWSSYHQYGVAVDFVLYENGRWSWNTKGKRREWWDRLHEIGRELGLEPLSWEKPHLQIAGLSTSSLREGKYPPDGDLDWASNLEAAIYSWDGQPSAPSIPDIIADRPPIESITPTILDMSEAPKPINEDWHSRYGGREWRYDMNGIYIKEYKNGNEPLRTLGEPITCRKIMQLIGDEIIAASNRYQIPIEIIMMIITTETAFARNYGFTGPLTFRWEPNVEVTDVSPPIMGDYSAGPMQTLATTARWVINVQSLNYDPFVVAPVYEKRPEPPQEHPLYDYDNNIDIGAAEIKQRLSKTGLDPILVAAAYNSGGVYKSSKNEWHLRTHGDHLDRAARWYGDACAVVSEFKAR